MLTVIGEALLDLAQPEPGGPYVAWPGGGPLNIAVGLRRLGHDTELMARFSTGPLGDVVRRHAEDNGLALDSCVSTADQTTLAFATLDAEGRASYDFYVNGTADWGWTDEELARLPAGTTIVHTGSLAAAIAPGAERLLRLFEGLYAQGDIVTSYDPNIRPRLVGPRDVAVSMVERFVAAARVVKASDEDVGWLYPDADHVDVLRRWSRSGPELVVMTRGSAGCVAVSADGALVEADGVSVGVVDTIGAGDSFQSGLLSGLVDAGCVTPDALSAMRAEGLQSVLSRATLVSAMTCERAGADPPSRAEYLTRMGE